MSDEFEDRLRTHLAAKAAQVQVDPDPGALMERSVGRSWHRGILAVGAVAIALIFAGSGVLTGVNLVGGRSAASPLASAPSTTVPSRAGASLAPSSSEASNLPSTATQTPYTFLFARTTSSGVTIRAYGYGSSTTGGCTQAALCPPVGIVPGPTPCPKGAICAQPTVIPQAQSGATGDGRASAGGTASSGNAVGAPKTLPAQPNGSGSGGSSVGTAPSQPTAECGQLVIELSTAKAVGSGTVPRPTMAPSPDKVELLGVGSFGIAEGAPVDWVAVWVGSGMASVHLSSGGTAVDAMAPSSGIVVLAVPGNSELAGATVVGVSQTGAVVATVPADQGASNACAILPTPAPAITTTTPTTTRPTTAPTTPTNTSVRSSADRGAPECSAISPSRCIP